jgi:hypothetical protein
MRLPASLSFQADGEQVRARDASKVIVIPRFSCPTSAEVEATVKGKDAGGIGSPVEIPLEGGEIHSAFHHVQAYEDGAGSIIVDTCMFADMQLGNPLGFVPNSRSFNPELNADGQTLTRVCIDVAAQRASCRPLLLRSPQHEHPMPLVSACAPVSKP